MFGSNRPISLNQSARYRLAMLSIIQVLRSPPPLLRAFRWPQAVVLFSVKAGWTPTILSSLRHGPHQRG